MWFKTQDFRKFLIFVNVNAIEKVDRTVLVCEGNDSLANLNFCDSVEENNDITENISTSEDQETEKILTVYPKRDKKIHDVAIESYPFLSNRIET